MQMNSLLVFALLAATACTTTGQNQQSGIDVPIGKNAYVDGPIIRPIRVIEDSRCPANARCIWAGTVKVEAIWVRDGHRNAGRHSGNSAANRAFLLELGRPQPLADGMIELTNVSPPRMAGANRELKPQNYRLSFRFTGGI
jgi:hypothetical protein